MSSPTTKQESIKELLKKIHELRLRKLLQVDYIETEAKKIVKTLSDLDEDLKKIQKDLNDNTINNGRAIVLCKLVEARKKVVEGYKSTLKECRMMITLLIKTEGKLLYDLDVVEHPEE